MNIHVGCEHNVSRTIEYPRVEWKKWTKETFEPGQMLTLVCPEGCKDVYVMLTTMRNK